MDVLVALQAVLLWVAGLFLLHRLNVRRLRAQAGLVALRRLDWDALLSGLLPERADEPLDALPSTLPDGTPTPALLRRRPAAATRSRHAALVGLVSGAAPGAGEARSRFEQAGFSGGEVRWLCILSRLHRDPLGALAELEAGPVASAAELYLREYLTLLHRAHVLNLELVVVAARRRLAQGLTRFGDVPALHLARGLAASLVGWNHAATDDLARAGYFSQMAPFYLRAVLDSPWLAESRPELVLQCQKAWDSRRHPTGEIPGSG